MTPRSSDAAARRATGRGWAGWFDALAAAEEGTPLEHQALVAWLEERHAEATSAWWRQMIVNEYEKHTGRRELGETTDAGFQLGASKTVDASPDRIWSALAGPDGLGRWLGGVDLELQVGTVYSGGPDPGTGAGDAPFATPLPPHGEVRVVVPGDRIRVTWQPGDWPRPSTLQVRLADSGTGKTRVSFHHEHLPDADARTAMRSRWKKALAELAAEVA